MLARPSASARTCAKCASCAQPIVCMTRPHAMPRQAMATRPGRPGAAIPRSRVTGREFYAATLSPQQQVSLGGEAAVSGFYAATLSPQQQVSLDGEAAVIAFYAATLSPQQQVSLDGEAAVSDSRGGGQA